MFGIWNPWRGRSKTHTASVQLRNDFQFFLTSSHLTINMFFTLFLSNISSRQIREDILQTKSQWSLNHSRSLMLQKRNSEIQCVHLQQFSRTGVARRIFDADRCSNVLQAYLTIHIPYRMLECSRQHPSLPRIQKVPGLIFVSDIGNPEWENLILMYVPCILYSLLPRPTNAQYIYIYIYIH